MTPTPTIRSATPADVPHVLPFVRAICDLHAAQDPERFAVRVDVLDRYARWLPERATDPRSVFLVAQRADRSLCGYLVGTVEAEVPIFWIPECGFIHDIWIEPSERRHHLAQQLTEAACERFKSIGVKQVRLHTAAFNDTARKLFASAGFRPCVVEMLRPIA